MMSALNLPAAAEPAKRASAVMSWSGGKDSALALHAARHDGRLSVDVLLTTVTDAYDRVSMHGVRVALLEAQAAAIGLPVALVRIPPACPNDVYERVTRAAFAERRERGASCAIFGDLYLEDVRAYRERLLDASGIAAWFPLWGRPTDALAREFIALGFRAVLTCVDPRQLDASFCGREFDAALLADLPPSADPCGERGEFHTFVYDGPIFSAPVSWTRGAVVDRDGFWFCDLVPTGG